MKLIIYNRDNEVIMSDGIRDPVVDGNSISWEGGSMVHIKLPFLLLDDSIDLKEGDAVTDDHISQDKKQQYQKRNLEKENTDLKKQMADLSFELMMKGVL